jgi:hypothetical protein
MWWLIIALSITLNHIDSFELKNRMDDWLTELIYIAFSVLIFIIITPIVEWLLNLFGLDEYVGTSPNIKIVRVYSDEREVLYSIDSQVTAGTIVPGSIITGS